MPANSQNKTLEKLNLDSEHQACTLMILQELIHTKITSLKTALQRLREALSAPETDLNRDAAIQRFEFCFELAWKAIQEKARAEGLDCYSPKSCLKLGFKNRWVQEEKPWLVMLEDQNRTSHTYDEVLAAAVYSRLPNYLPLFQSLIKHLE